MDQPDKQQIDKLLSRIEAAVGEFPDRHGTNGVLITEIVQSVNGLRSLLDVVRAH